MLILENLSLPYGCPLIEQKLPLEPQFIQAVYEAWSRLIEDPLIYDLVAYDSSQRQGPLEIIYP